MLLHEQQQRGWYGWSPAPLRFPAGDGRAPKAEFGLVGSARGQEPEHSRCEHGQHELAFPEGSGLTTVRAVELQEGDVSGLRISWNRNSCHFEG